jgi:hypothetical protein
MFYRTHTRHSVFSLGTLQAAHGCWQSYGQLYTTLESSTIPPCLLNPPAPPRSEARIGVLFVCRSTLDLNSMSIMYLEKGRQQERKLPPMSCP